MNETATSAPGGLEVADLVVRFGGNVAVDGLSLVAPIGRLTGLIGPNGAGKTTTFAAISGLVRPSSGQMSFLDADITSMPPARRARLGIGRTFQSTELCSSLTVRENVALGREARTAGSNPWRQLVSTPNERAAIRESADRALELCAIGPIAERVVASISVGQRRLVELARAVAGDYELLLLDEPSSGLDNAETCRFGQSIRAIVDESGLGILLVEHDMNLVMAVCDYLYTLDFGKLIFEGTTAETRASAVVRTAYLGGDVVELVGTQETIA